MPVIQRRTTDLSGAYGNIQRANQQRAEIERGNKSTTAQVLEGIQPIFERLLINKMNEASQDRNKVKITQEMIDGFSTENKLTPQAVKDLQPFLNKKVSPEFIRNFQRELKGETAFEAMIGGKVPGITDEDKTMLRALPPEQRIDEALKLGKLNKERNRQKKIREGLSPADQKAFDLDPDAFNKERATQQAKVPFDREKGEIIFVDSQSGKEVRREPNPDGGTKVVKVGAGKEKEQTPHSVAQKAFNDALRTGFFGDTYIKTIASFADELGLEESEIPTFEDPLPEGLAEKIFSFQGSSDGKDGEENVFDSMEAAEEASEKLPAGTEVTVLVDGKKKKFKVE